MISTVSNPSSCLGGDAVVTAEDEEVCRQHSMEVQRGRPGRPCGPAIEHQQDGSRRCSDSGIEALECRRAEATPLAGVLHGEGQRRCHSLHISFRRLLGTFAVSLFARKHLQHEQHYDREDVSRRHHLPKPLLASHGQYSLV